MQASIVHEERRSLFGTLRNVDVIVRVEFSETERAIVRDRNLENWIVLERTPDSKTSRALNPSDFERWEESFHLRIRHLLPAQGDRFSLDSPSDAKAYQTQLTEALEALKRFIDGNARLGPPTRLRL